MSVCSSSQKRKRRDPNKARFKTVGNHKEFLSRITKTLYYGKLPLTERFSLPVTELAAELYSGMKSRSLERLRVEEAAEISRNACVSPCSLVLALIYMERIKNCNPDYIDRASPSELFLVSMMVASKFLHDDGEDDSVFNDEWAVSAGLDLKQVNQLELDFLDAINWEVYVRDDAFWARLHHMERQLALKEGSLRGWFHYTELVDLLDTIHLSALTQTLFTVSAVCLTSYTASMLTLVGSALIVSQLPPLPLTPSTIVHLSTTSDESLTATHQCHTLADYPLAEHQLMNNDSVAVSCNGLQHWQSTFLTWLITDFKKNRTLNKAVLYSGFDHRLSWPGTRSLGWDENEKWLQTVSEIVDDEIVTHNGFYPIQIVSH